MSSKTTHQNPHEHVRRGSIGNLLRTTRQNRNRTLTEAATVTRISERILTALEADDFATLPAEVFTRGFIKIYAEYLGLDPNEILRIFTDQENLDPERPADRPYRRDILFGTAMAHPLQLFKGNPRLRIIAMLVAALLCFYALGAIFKSLQRHPDQDAPENEVAKSLVNAEAPTLPGPPGVELPPVDVNAVLGLAGPPAPPGLTPEAPGGSAEENAPAPPAPGAGYPTVPAAAPAPSPYPRIPTAQGADSGAGEAPLPTAGRILPAAPPAPAVTPATPVTAADGAPTR